MKMTGERQVPALLRAKVDVSDKVSVTKTVGLKVGYMVLSEFVQELGAVTSKVFPTESSARAYGAGQEIIKVDIIRKFD
jgi:hypothetical protein